MAYRNDPKRGAMELSEKNSDVPEDTSEQLNPNFTAESKPTPKDTNPVKFMQKIKGQLFFPNGSLQYLGEIYDAQANGEGESYYKTGNLEYKGGWYLGKWHGEGWLFNKSSEGLEYQGGWRMGEKNGLGK
jgi:hypothetical protein